MHAIKCELFMIRLMSKNRC